MLAEDWKMVFYWLSKNAHLSVYVDLLHRIQWDEWTKCVRFYEFQPENYFLQENVFHHFFFFFVALTSFVFIHTVWMKGVQLFYIYIWDFCIYFRFCLLIFSGIDSNLWQNRRNFFFCSYKIPCWIVYYVSKNYAQSISAREK